ncbi:MAG: hypothetical protein V4692_06960, partial [Bdellovibrionota bacterium]
MVVSTATTVMHAIFLKRERLSLIDQQVRGTAVALLDSDLASPANINIRRAERTISEELGENRIGKFFIIRNGNGDVLFDSTTTELLKIPRVPQNPQWVTIEEKGKYIRILNLALPSIPDRTLQVGIVIDQDILSPSYFSTTSVGFIAIALSLGLIVAWLLASFLVRPISVLADFISDSAKEP